MSRKITVGAALALALLMVAASIPLTMLYAQSQQNKLIPNLPALVGKFNALEEIQKKVNDEFYKKPAEDAVNAGMVRGYIEGLNDPKNLKALPSRYLSPEEYQNYRLRLDGKAPEMGIVLKYSPEVFGLVIDQVKAGSTAAVSGLAPDDHIVKAESGGKVLFNEPEVEPDKATEAINAFYEATSVTADTSSISISITYKRNGDLRPPVNVMLGNAVSSISAYLMDAWAEPGKTPAKTVGYIKVFHFFKNTAEQIETAVKDLSNKQAVSYILDLRGCSEGNLESVCKAIDLFADVSQGTDSMVTVHYKDGSVVPHPSIAGNLTSYATGGLAVLIDGRTSGVAELFAHDLRAYNPGKVFLVGKPTRGINTVQEPFPLASVGGAALLTVGTLVPYAYSGDAPWNEDGTQPNEPSEADAKEGFLYDIAGAEQQLNGAIAILTKPRKNA